MTDNQKVLISVLGAVLGHLLLFLLLAILFTIANLFAPSRSQAAAAVARAPEEVTILLSDLLDQVELTPRELTQQYMRTDADQEVEEAPDDAPFHSDKNTRLTSDRAPVNNQPDEMPSITGRTDLPLVQNRNRELVDGDFLEQSLTSATAAPSNPSPAVSVSANTAMTQTASKPAPIRDPSETEAELEEKNEADPADRPREAPESEFEKPADADTPPPTLAELVSQPDAQINSDTPMLAQRAESFDSGFAADPLRREEIADLDRKAEAREVTETKAEPTAPAPPEAASALPRAEPLVAPNPQMAAVSPSSEPVPPRNASANIPPSPKPPSDTPAFTPHTRATQMDGGADAIGNTAAFDVEASELGKYKKAVTDAVERTWHRYRERHSDFVTYGTLKVKFRVDKNGKPRNLKLIKNDANAVMAEFTLKAVLEADIPKMPEDIAAMLGTTGLEINYDVIVY